MHMHTRILIQTRNISTSKRNIILILKKKYSFDPKAFCRNHMLSPYAPFFEVCVSEDGIQLPWKKKCLMNDFVGDLIGDLCCLAWP